jgi:hypothetical protein
VSSPRYQTLPWSSSAYQSSVASASVPSGRRTTSRTTTALTPAIFLVRSVIRTFSTNLSSPSVPCSRVTRPGVSGNQALSTGFVKCVGSNAGDVLAAGSPADDVRAGAARTPVPAASRPRVTATVNVRRVVMPRP